MPYILLAAAIIITIFNAIFLYRSRKFKRIAAQKYRELMGHLKDKTLEVMEEEGLHFNHVYHFATDINEGYFISVDTARRKVSIASKKDMTSEVEISLYDFSDIVSSSVEVVADESDPRYYKRVTLHVQTKTSDGTLEITIGHNKAKRTSSIGEFVLSTAEQNNSVFQKIVNGEKFEENADS